MTLKHHRNRLAVQVGQVFVGGNNPVVIQSMTNTDTANVHETVKQIIELWQAGSEIVRVTVNNEEAAKAVPEIYNALLSKNCNVPIVGDFHFNGHKLLKSYEDCAQALAKYRINPGNVGKGSKKDAQFAEMIQFAIEYNKPIRIGVNWGSLDQEMLAKMMDENNQLNKPLDAKSVMREALIVSALTSAEQAVEIGLPKDKIILSCKTSDTQDLIFVYQELSNRCQYPLHLGLTEAGIGTKGVVASAASMGYLLQNGIGDTIRISLTPEPNESRTKEVIVAQELLQSLGIRSFVPLVTACPGCGRTSSTFFQELAANIQRFLRTEMPQWRKQYKGVESMTVAVMGCVVNGPGESKLANIGISLPGTGEIPVAPVYEDGEKTVTLKGDKITEEFQDIIRKYIDKKYKKI